MQALLLQNPHRRRKQQPLRLNRVPVFKNKLNLIMQMRTNQRVIPNLRMQMRNSLRKPCCQRVGLLQWSFNHRVQTLNHLPSVFKMATALRGAMTTPVGVPVKALKPPVQAIKPTPGVKPPVPAAKPPVNRTPSNPGAKPPVARKPKLTRNPSDC